MTINLADLKPGRNSAKMTANRAFTICELIALRVRDEENKLVDPVAWAIANEIAEAIREVANLWRD